MITPEIRDSIEASVLCWLATVSADGIPNVSPKEAFYCNEEDHILIAHVASPQTIANLQQQPEVCLSFIDIFTQRGFKIHGQASILESDHEDFRSRSAILATMVGPSHKILALIVIRPTAVAEVVAPSYTIHPETTERDMVKQSLETYRVKHYQSLAE